MSTGHLLCYLLARLFRLSLLPGFQCPSDAASHAIGAGGLLKPCLAAELYAKLGRQMALPQTACLALPGPLGPVLGTSKGRAWFDEEDEAEAIEVQAGTHFGICPCSTSCTARSATAPR